MRNRFSLKTDGADCCHIDLLQRRRAVKHLNHELIIQK